MALSVFEFEVWLSTSDALKAGVVDLDRRKYLVAAGDDREAYDIAIDMAWRDDRPGPQAPRAYAGEGWQVTKVWYVL
jgi:hypothetical protein